MPSAPPIYYEVQTAATYGDSITICFTYDENEILGPENQVKLFHFEDTVGWTEITLADYPDTINNVICGLTNSLSLFIAAESSCCNHDGIHGDVNYDLSGPNVADLTFLVNYLFRSGPPPPCDEEADVNGDVAGPNVADLTYLVDFLFRGGTQPPPCP